MADRSADYRHWLHLCLPGFHPALIGLLRHGYRIQDWDLAMTTPELT